MRATRTPIAVLLALTGILGGCQCTSYAQQDVIKFTFNPPTPLSYTVIVKTTKVNGTGPSDTQTSVGIIKVKADMTKTPKGYKLVQRPTSATVTRNGQPVPSNPLVDRLMKVNSTSDLDETGWMLNVQGFDEVIKVLSEQAKLELPAEQYQKLTDAMPGIKKAATAQEITEWNGRVADFVGRSAKIGDTWVEDQTAELPYGMITYNTTTKIAERVRKGKVDCVRIAFTYTTDAEGTQKFMQAMMDSLAESAAPGKAPKIVDVKISGGGERLVDPKTMLIYSETNDRTVTMILDDPDEGRLEVRMPEKKEYTYQYGK